MLDERDRVWLCNVSDKALSVSGAVFSGFRGANRGVGASRLKIAGSKGGASRHGVASSGRGIR